MRQYTIMELSKAIAKASVAYDQLCDLWNLSLVAEDREAIEQNSLDKFVRPLHEYVNRMQARLAKLLERPHD